MRTERGEEEKNPTCSFFFFYPNVGLFSFGYLNKLPDRGEKGPRILISCCCGKVNERGAAGEAGRVLHHGAFYDRPPPPMRALSHSKAVQFSHRLGQDRRFGRRQDVFVTGAL